MRSAHFLLSPKSNRRLQLDEKHTPILAFFSLLLVLVLSILSVHPHKPNVISPFQLITIITMLFLIELSYMT